MQLINVENSRIGHEVKQTVNARDLHSFLEVKAKFADWIKNQIDRARLVENRDYVTLSINLETGGATKEYHLTIEAGKSIGMMSATDKGFEIRDYFLECERRAKDPIAMLNDPAILKNLLLANLQTVEEQKKQIEQRDRLIADVAPKAAIADKLVISDGLYNLTHAAKLLNIPPREFNKMLEAKEFIYRMGVKGTWTGHAPKIKSGYIEHKIHQYKKVDGTDGSSIQVFLTAKGLHRLAQVFSKSLDALPFT